MLHSKAPSRIVIASCTSFVLAVVSVATALGWLAQSMNDMARQDATKLVQTNLETAGVALENRIRPIGSWPLAFERANASDLDWLSQNFGVNTVNGNSVTAIAFIGGPYAPSIGWQDGGELTPSAELINTTIAEAILQSEASSATTSGSTGAFFAVQNGEVFLFAAHRMLMGDTLLDQNPALFFAMGQVYDPELLAQTSDMLLVDDLVFSIEPSKTGVQVPLEGIGGETVGYFSWTPTAPGTVLLGQMRPALTGVFVLGLLATVFSAVGASRLARSLVERRAEAVQAARTDVLTGLPSRYALQEHLDAKETVGTPELGVLFIDLNGFKRINDAFSHAAGDKIVCDVATRIAGLMDADMRLYRAGGDEFVVVASGDGSLENQLIDLSTDINQSLEDVFYYDGQIINVTASKGLAIRSDVSIPAQELVRRADIAMYRAKKSRNSAGVAYSPDMEITTTEDKEMERALRTALTQPEQFYLAYQPIIDSKSGEFIRAEALARWTSPTLGVVPPDKFIGIAENAGLILTLSKLLYDQMCRDLLKHPDLKISCNISPIQLQTNGFTEEMIECLRSNDIDPERVEVELTEGVIVTDPDLVAFRLDLLKECGFSTALDDFGTGYSSIGYLRQMPFDTLKIDRSLLWEGDQTQSQVDMLRSVILLGQSLGQKVLCEGVETQEQADLLQRLDCDMFQGYLFARPMPLPDLINWIDAREAQLQKAS